MNVIQTSIAGALTFDERRDGAAIRLPLSTGEHRQVGAGRAQPPRWWHGRGRRMRLPGRGDWSSLWRVASHVLRHRDLTQPKFRSAAHLLRAVWTLNSYISARMFGLTGRGVGFPTGAHPSS